MRMTAAANRWMRTVGRMYSVKLVVVVVKRAKEIAKERGARVLGRMHLELALEELGQEEEDGESGG